MAEGGGESRWGETCEVMSNRMQWKINSKGPSLRTLLNGSLDQDDTEKTSKWETFSFKSCSTEWFYCWLPCSYHLTCSTSDTEECCTINQFTIICFANGPDRLRRISKAFFQLSSQTRIQPRLVERITRYSRDLSTLCSSLLSYPLHSNSDPTFQISWPMQIWELLCIWLISQCCLVQQLYCQVCKVLLYFQVLRALGQKYTFICLFSFNALRLWKLLEVI